jgi:hypothetical protein
MFNLGRIISLFHLKSHNKENAVGQRYGFVIGKVTTILGDLTKWHG